MKQTGNLPSVLVVEDSRVTLNVLTGYLRGMGITSLCWRQAIDLSAGIVRTW